jgi:hypothetical protein
MSGRSYHDPSYDGRDSFDPGMYAVSWQLACASPQTSTAYRLHVQPFLLKGQNIQPPGSGDTHLPPTSYLDPVSGGHSHLVNPRLDLVQPSHPTSCYPGNYIHGLSCQAHQQSPADTFPQQMLSIDHSSQPPSSMNGHPSFGLYGSQYGDISPVPRGQFDVQVK